MAEKMHLLPGRSTCSGTMARRVGALQRQLNPPDPPHLRSSSLRTTSGFVYGGVSATPTFGFSTGAEALSSLPFDAEEMADSGIETPSLRIQKPSRDKVILVIGAGAGTGGAVAKRFAQEGYVACIVRRHKEKLQPLAAEIIEDGGQAYSFGVDARKEEEVVKLVEHIEGNIGEIEVLVFNIGANEKRGILETTARLYYKVWEMACFAGFLTGREVARHMVRRNMGTIFFTGATASVKGGSGFAAFAGAKFALRALAQSMARELGPKGVHVVHAVVDAGVNTVWTRGMIKDSDSLISSEGMVEPEDVAELYWHLHQQPKRSWTHEIDVRPWKEPW